MSDGLLSCSEHQCALDLTVLCKNRNQLLIQAMFQQYPTSNFLILILNQNAADRWSKTHWLGIKSFSLFFYSKILMSNKVSLSSLDIRSSIFHSPTIGAKPWSLVCSLHWTHWIVLQMLCLHLIKMQFVVLCNSVLLRSGTNDCWTMSSSYISVRTNTQKSFWRSTCRR